MVLALLFAPQSQYTAPRPGSRVNSGVSRIIHEGTLLLVGEMQIEQVSTGFILSWKRYNLTYLQSHRVVSLGVNDGLCSNLVQADGGGKVFKCEWNLFVLRWS